ncbi:TPA: hypothetical protein QIF36_002381 [Enterobacter kobei]|nr:hypothetical protein [Enterobacter kobei]
MSVHTGTTLGSVLFVGGVSAGRAFPEVDVAVLAAALCGALIFVITAQNYSILKKWALLLPSAGGGVILGKFIAALLTATTPDFVIAGETVGAFLSGACIVQFLARFTDNPGAVFRAIWDVVRGSVTDIFRKGGGGHG